MAYIFRVCIGWLNHATHDSDDDERPDVKKCFLAKSHMSYPWMSYSQAAKYEDEARRLRVSQVARSSGGFMREYQAAGSSRAMKNRKVPGYGDQVWNTRRDAFIKRHLAQYKRNPTRRRFLALCMWAFRATPPPKTQKVSPK